jgi:hypothetical protein
MYAREETIPKEVPTVHFDNAPIYNTEMVREMLTQWNIARMDQPPRGPDLAPYDFLIFGDLKLFVRDVQFSTEQQLVNVIIGFLEAISPKFWSDVFENWKGRLRTCVVAGGIYFEQDLTNGVFRFCLSSLGFQSLHIIETPCNPPPISLPIPHRSVVNAPRSFLAAPPIHCRSPPTVSQIRSQSLL